MKAVLIFKGGACSVLFYQRDLAFAEYLHAHPQYNVAVSDLGMNEEDFATGLLKPLLASCMSMQHVLKNAYQHLQSGKVSLVCSYYQSLTFVAVNGDGQETVDFMRRKLAALHALMRMSLGPVIETISENRHAAQQKFASLFGTWCCLMNNEQCFLIEAIEKLYINQASESLSKKCVEALEDVVAKWNSSTGATDAKPLLKIDHAALFARDKLLALYSKRRKKLSPYDLLLSVVYMLDRFPPTDWCELETASQPLPNRPNIAGRQRPVSAYSVSSNENYETSDDLVYSDREDTISGLALSEVDKISGDSTTADCFVSPSSTPTQSPIDPLDKRALPTAPQSATAAGDAASKSATLERESASTYSSLGSSAFGREAGDTDRSCIGSDRHDSGAGADPHTAAAVAGAAVSAHDVFPEAVTSQVDPGEESDQSVTVARGHEQAPLQVCSDSGTNEPLAGSCIAQPLAINAEQLELGQNHSSVDGEGSDESSMVCGDDVIGSNDAEEACSMCRSESNNDGDDEHSVADIAAGPDPTFAEASTNQQATESVLLVSAPLDDRASMMPAHLEQPSDANGRADADRPSGRDLPDFGAQSKNEWLEALVGNIAQMAEQALTQTGVRGHSESSPTASHVSGDMSAPTTRDLDRPDKDTLWDHPTMASFRRPGNMNKLSSLDGQRESFTVERVFVKQDGYYVPKDMYIISVLPGINLVLFSEDLPPRSRMARNLQVAMSNLSALLDPGGRMRLAFVQPCVQNVNDEVESIVKALREGGSGAAGASRYAADLAEHWQSVAGSLARRRELVDSLGSCLALGRPLPADVEQGLADALADLCRIFVALYCAVPSPASARAQREAAASLVESTRSFLGLEVGDFADFFVARAQRNFTMAQFQSPPFEGLFHFVFVNRTSNYMAAPSLLPDVSDDGSSRRSAAARLNLFIKHRLWSNVEWIYSQLQRAGCVTSLVWDADFVFSYMLWFEDSTGTPRPVPPQPALLRMPPPIGDFDGRFYRTLTRSLFKDEDVQCCEMFGVHLGMLPESVVLKQCQRLYHYVWHYIPLETEPI